jgi:hypothetical protein
MPEHVHGCLNCRPDMVPDFDPADSRYHNRSDLKKCASTFSVLVDGAAVGCTQGAFEGAEGWALSAGAEVGDIHECPACTTYTMVRGDRVIEHLAVCVEPRFGHVEVHHDGAC